MIRITVYHNTQSRFGPYEDGHQLVAVAWHQLDERVTAPNPVMIADWAYHVFNADLDQLDAQRPSIGETAYLSACLYRALGNRSLSVGDVTEIHIGQTAYWLACDPHTWRRITPPQRRTGPAGTTQAVYEHLRRTRGRW
jgi:hypothetical protein